jgi:SAM-dependent methyltransferase
MIGRSYAALRRPDARIARRLHAALGDAVTVVNVGAGSGSYEPTDRRVVAVEPSAVMMAQRGVSGASAVRGVAEALPFARGTFDAALVVLSVHHWRDLDAGLAELRRVADRQVVLMFDRGMAAGVWPFDEYFPAANAVEAARAPEVEQVVAALGGGAVDVVPVPHDCTDGFGGAYWRRPEAYLDPDVRACISSLAVLGLDDLEPGLTRLRDDLASGAWHERHADLLELQEADLGYRLIVAPG